MGSSCHYCFFFIFLRLLFIFFDSSTSCTWFFFCIRGEGHRSKTKKRGRSKEVGRGGLRREGGRCTRAETGEGNCESRSEASFQLFWCASLQSDNCMSNVTHNGPHARTNQRGRLVLSYSCICFGESVKAKELGGVVTRGEATKITHTQCRKKKTESNPWS